MMNTRLVSIDLLVRHYKKGVVEHEKARADMWTLAKDYDEAEIDRIVNHPLVTLLQKCAELDHYLIALSDAAELIGFGEEFDNAINDR
jgi:hypothetical protein